jgi:hypothetical protein
VSFGGWVLSGVIWDDISNARFVEIVPRERKAEQYTITNAGRGYLLSEVDVQFRQAIPGTL